MSLEVCIRSSRSIFNKGRHRLRHGHFTIQSVMVNSVLKRIKSTFKGNKRKIKLESKADPVPCSNRSSETEDSQIPAVETEINEEEEERSITCPVEPPPVESESVPETDDEPETLVPETDVVEAPEPLVPEVLEDPSPVEPESTPLIEEAPNCLSEPEDSESQDGDETFDREAIEKVFGERSLKLISATQWSDRQDGFVAIKQALKNMPNGHVAPSPDMLSASFMTVNLGIEDRVLPVVYCSLDCLRTVIKSFAPFADETFAADQAMSKQLSILIMTLMSKMNDSNKRTRKECIKALIRVLRLKILRPIKFISLQLSYDEIPLKARLRVISYLIPELGLNELGSLSVRDVLKVSLQALSHADEKKRSLAIDVVVAAYGYAPEEVSEQVQGLKPALLKVLETRFKECDESKAAAETLKDEEQHASDVDDDDMVHEDQPVASTYSEDSPHLQTLVQEADTDAEEMFGPVLWHKFNTDNWHDRHEALKESQTVLRTSKRELDNVRAEIGSIHQRHFASYCSTFYRLLNDPVVPVANDTLKCFVSLIGAYGNHIDFREENVKQMLMRCISTLTKKLNNSNKRTQTSAFKCIMKVARLNSIHGLGCVVSCLFRPETPLCGQMQLLKILIPEHGLSETGLTFTQVSAATFDALNATDEKTRKAGIDVAVAIKRLVGLNKVQKRFKGIRPATWKEVERNFGQESIEEGTSRPQTVNGPTDLPQVRPNIRHLNSAPVGMGPLCFEPPAEETSCGLLPTPRQVEEFLSLEEESLMDSIAVS